MASGIEEGTQVVHSDESPVFTIDVTNIGTSSGEVTSPTMTVYSLSDGEDVTTSVTSGGISVDGQVVTLKKLTGLTQGEDYRVHVLFTKDGGGEGVRLFVRCPLEKDRIDE